MNLPTAFDTFLITISLGKTPTERIESASNTLMKYLVDNYGIAADDVFLHGSYPNDTAVEPEDSDDGEYDVDFDWAVVNFRREPRWQKGGLAKHAHCPRCA